MLSRKKIGLDLGSYKIRLALLGHDDIEDLNVLALRKRKKGDGQEVIAVGENALKAADEHWGNPDFELVWPMAHGVISDYVASTAALRYYLVTILRSLWRFLWSTGRHPVVIVACPAGASEAAKQNLVDVVKSAFTADVLLIDNLLAIHGRSESTLHDDQPEFILQIGAGITTIGVVQMGGVSHARTISLAGNRLDVLIQRYLYDKFSNWVTLESCRHIKHETGTLIPWDQGEWTGEVRDQSGAEVWLKLTYSELRSIIEQGLSDLAHELRWFMKEWPAETQHAIQEKGLVLVGGSAKLHGLDAWLAEHLEVPVQVAHDPERAVLSGVTRILAELKVPWIGGIPSKQMGFKEHTR